MDTTLQRYPADATGWERGLYADVQATFRAPIVNWIWRTLVANEPAFTRYLWGQVKPAFQTEAFGGFSFAYRDAMLSAVEDADHELPAYRREHLDVSAAEFETLRSQLTTFDVVIPRLAVLFEIADRSLQGETVGGAADPSEAALAPLPEWVDDDRGTQPTMAAFDALPPGAESVVEATQDFHGLDEGLPSIYRCLLQWPDAFATMWTDLEPVLESAAFETACGTVGDLAGEYVEELAHSPRLTPADLQAAGFEDDTITDLADLFAEFNRGAIETVLPVIPLLAATLNVAGRRMSSPNGGR